MCSETVDQYCVMGEKAMPYLSKIDIEAIANRIIDQYKLRYIPSKRLFYRVDPIELAEMLGLSVCFRQLSYDHSGKDGVKDYVSVGAQGRYYIIQNGLYLGAGVKLAHTGSYNDVMPGVEVGYAFFLSRTVTIEPAIYYDQSFKNHSDFSTVGLRVGIGVYL